MASELLSERIRRGAADLLELHREALALEARYQSSLDKARGERDEARRLAEVWRDLAPTGDAPGNALPWEGGEEGGQAEAREAVMREALVQFEAWADGFAHPTAGMGAGLHLEMWPMLVPSAWKRMAEIAALGLRAND